MLLSQSVNTLSTYLTQSKGASTAVCSLSFSNTSIKMQHSMKERIFLILIPDFCLLKTSSAWKTVTDMLKHTSLYNFQWRLVAVIVGGSQIKICGI